MSQAFCDFHLPNDLGPARRVRSTQSNFTYRAIFDKCNVTLPYIQVDQIAGPVACDRRQFFSTRIVGLGQICNDPTQAGIDALADIHDRNGFERQLAVCLVDIGDLGHGWVERRRCERLLNIIEHLHELVRFEGLAIQCPLVNLHIIRASGRHCDGHRFHIRFAKNAAHIITAEPNAEVAGDGQLIKRKT